MSQKYQIAIKDTLLDILEY